MFGRGVLAFLMCPGMVAYGLPSVWIRPSPLRGFPFQILGGVAAAVGSGLLLWCARDFLVVGQGTLAPWAPPQSLVRVGLYRVSRNPMYLAVSLVLCGWTACFQSRSLMLYSVSMMVVFHLRVVFGEEPWLARRYGEEWRAYCARVPRWLI